MMEVTRKETLADLDFLLEKAAQKRERKEELGKLLEIEVVENVEVKAKEKTDDSINDPPVPPAPTRVGTTFTLGELIELLDESGMAYLLDEWGTMYKTLEIVDLVEDDFDQLYEVSVLGYPRVETIGFYQYGRYKCLINMLGNPFDDPRKLGENVKKDLTFSHVYSFCSKGGLKVVKKSYAIRPTFMDVKYTNGRQLQAILALIKGHFDHGYPKKDIVRIETKARSFVNVPVTFNSLNNLKRFCDVHEIYCTSHAWKDDFKFVDMQRLVFKERDWFLVNMSFGSGYFIDVRKDHESLYKIRVDKE